MKKYIDISHINNIGLFIRNKDIELVYTGIKINPISLIEKDELYNKYKDIHFIFENNIPDISFYCVPYIELIAFDDNGYIGLSHQQVYYISDQCYKIADNIENFQKNIEHYKDHLILCNDIIIYSSKEEAYKKLDILEYKENHSVVE